LVAAQGAGAQNFSGFYENTRIHIHLSKALGGMGLPANKTSSSSGQIQGW
jgi:hypothetical protein